jgi:hypothetical protein
MTLAYQSYRVNVDLHMQLVALQRLKHSIDVFLGRRFRNPA